MNGSDELSFRPLNSSRAIVAFAIAASTLFSGCGYMLGPNLRQGVRTIHVPVVQSESHRRDVDYLLTESLQEEIRLRTGYQLAEATNADTILRCQLIDIRKNPLSETRFDDPREIQLLLGAQVSWVDRRSGQILHQQTFPVSQQLSRHSSQVSFAPEVGQSMATATQDAVRKLASEIVDITDQPW